MNGTRCWKFYGDGCRANGTNTIRRGDIVTHYCDDPKHDPRTARDHLAAIDDLVAESAADLGLDEDTVWHDVALAYIKIEIHSEPMKVEVGHGLGLDADVVLP